MIVVSDIYSPFLLIISPATFSKMKRWTAKIYHKTVYDFKSIKKVLNESGFKDVKYYDWKEMIYFEHDWLKDKLVSTLELSKCNEYHPSIAMEINTSLAIILTLN